MGMCACICSCVHTYAHVCAGTHPCVCVYVRPEINFRCLLLRCHPVSHWPEIWLSWLARKPQECVFSFKTLGYECVPPLLAPFMWVPGLSLRSFCLFSSHRPSPCLCPFPTQTLAAPAVVVCLILQTVPAALVSCRHCRGACPCLELPCPEKKLHCHVLAHLCLSFPHSEMALAEVNDSSCILGSVSFSTYF